MRLKLTVFASGIAAVSLCCSGVAQEGRSPAGGRSGPERGGREGNPGGSGGGSREPAGRAVEPRGIDVEGHVVGDREPTGGAKGDGKEGKAKDVPGKTSVTPATKAAVKAAIGLNSNLNLASPAQIAQILADLNGMKLTALNKGHQADAKYISREISRVEAARDKRR